MRLDDLEPAALRQVRKTLPGKTVQAPAVAEAAATVLTRSSEALAAIRDPDGFWRGDLKADSTLESDYVLLQLWLHPPVEGVWKPSTWPRIQKAAQSILDRQLPDGGFNIYPQGPAEISASVKAYTALKLAGLDPETPAMARARERILKLGGVQAANSYVKINLSLFDLYPRKHVATVPPELVLLPGDALYKMSSWTRAIVVPLSIVQALRKDRPLPQGFHLREIFSDKPLRYESGIRPSWRNFFLWLDRALKVWDKRAVKQIREWAIREAEHWILDRTRHSEGLGAIYPAMMYSIMALDALGYGSDHPDLAEAIRQFDSLLVETRDRFYFQPCVSPVWDTAIAAFALGEAGTASPDFLRASADWLISKEVRRKGDWSIKRPNLEPSGWYFEFANEYYPDIDDTAQVLLAFHYAKASDPDRQKRCERRAIDWILGMQSRDGGWAAFDVDNDLEILNQVPFADHNAMLDPTCADVTGRVLEALVRRGIDRESPAIRRGVDFLVSQQEEPGGWYGRWGVNYIYGSFLAMRGLSCAGGKGAQEAVRKAAGWLGSIQRQDGGWGESCASYNVNGFVPAGSTPSQTAWALLGLMAAGERAGEAVRRGVQFLIDTQESDGLWTEELATGTGFPCVFYLCYGLYSSYFPVLALATYLKT
jgi:squalene-hopene/tetraprenyl-beta-curcumene cyclase